MRSAASCGKDGAKAAEPTVEKPSFTQAQMVTSSDVVKHFSEIRKHAKEKPVLIMNNGW